MFVPGPTAESALYQSRKHYRTVAGGAGVGGGVQLASCVDECMSECMAGGGESFECKPMCRHSCSSPPPPPCDSFRVDGKEYCCFRGTERCIGEVRPDGGRNVSCLQRGMGCCNGIAYWLDTEVCLNGNVQRCWPGEKCMPFGCCKPEEACTPEGCIPRSELCAASGRRCKPGEVCTSEGCVPRSEFCPASGRRCAPGEVCTQQDGCCRQDSATSSRSRCCGNQHPCPTIGGEECCDECCEGQACCNHPGTCGKRTVVRGQPGVPYCRV